MSFLSVTREKIEAYARDTAAPGGARHDVTEDVRALWMPALRRGELLFSRGLNRVKYASFRDIDFSGPEIRNQEWRAQLNRYYWLGPLAAEYLDTRDERCAEIARETLEAWIDYRRFTGTETLNDVWPSTGDNCLSVSIRLGQGKLAGWWGCVPYFEGSPHFDDAFIDRMRKSTREQLNFLYRNITRYGNFRISQMDTFLFLGLILPDAAEYLPYAVRGINETFRLQVGTDGSHCEHTAGYHTWMRDIYTRYALLGKARPELGIDLDGEKLSGMWRYALANHTPDGRGWGIGDTVRWHPAAKPADLTAFRENYAALRRNLGLPEESPDRTAFPSAGQYFVRSGDNAFALDATNFGGWHGHPARGSILCYYGGRLLLCDPGSLNYERSDPLMAAGRLTPMHNTITVNDGAQLPQADARVPFFVDTEVLTFTQCIYAGGWSNTCPWKPVAPADLRSTAGRHTRTFLWLKGHIAVTLDVLEVYAPAARFAAHWQLQEGPSVFDPDRKSLRTDSGNANLLVCCPWSSVPTSAVRYEGDRDRLLGYVSNGTSGLNGGTPAPMLSVEGTLNGNGRTYLLHVLAPCGGHVPDIRAEVTLDDVLYLRLTVDGTLCEIAADTWFLAGENNHTSVGKDCPMPADGPFAVRTPDTAWVYRGELLV